MLAVWRIGSVFGDAGESEGFGVGPVGVAVVAFEENGNRGEKFVEIFFVGQSIRGEHGVIPATAEKPLVVGMLVGIGAQAILNVGYVGGTFEIDVSEGEAAVHHVNVGIGERRENELAAGIDHLCADATEAFYLFVGADGNDFSLANGEALRPRLLFVGGIDFGVDDENVRGRNAHGALGESRGPAK